MTVYFYTMWDFYGWWGKKYRDLVWKNSAWHGINWVIIEATKTRTLQIVRHLQKWHEHQRVKLRVKKNRSTSTRKLVPFNNLSSVKLGVIFFLFFIFTYIILVRRRNTKNKNNGFAIFLLPTKIGSSYTSDIFFRFLSKIG